MDYLLLWSGQKLGMRKARIPSAPCRAFIHHIDENGAAVVPDIAAIGAALPKRYRAAFDRHNGMMTKADCRPYAPITFDLKNTLGRRILQLVLQPLTEEAGIPFSSHVSGGGSP